MPAPQMDLDPFKAEIQDRIAAGESQKDVRRWLAAKGVQIHRNTLSTRLLEWQGTSTQVPSIDATLVAEVDSAFHTTHHDDQTIADNIAASGIPTTHRQVKRIRLTQGWRRRGNTDDQLADSRAKTFALVKSALHQGVVRCYGRGLLRTYLRVAHGHQARDDDVRDALSTLDTAGTESRRKGPSKSRQGGEYITPGPDWLWCCDGHDKFRNYGIEIYACVDAYSRRIQWCYVGNSNRRAVSILRQVVTTVKAYNRCPSFFRSDRGKEVLLLADAHYSLYVLHKKATGTCPEDEDELKLRDCYMFGTSTANIKIESSWFRMIRSQTKPWLVCYI